MQLTIPVGLRSYAESESSDALFVAATLEPPFVSAAAGSSKDVLARLRAGLEDTLSRAHPRMFGKLGPEGRRTLEVHEAPFFKSAGYDWRGGDDGWQINEKILNVAFHTLIRDVPGGLIEVSLPQFHAWTMFDPTERYEPEDDQPATLVDRAVADLADALRRNERHVGLHRPQPEDFSIIDLQVEFEPLTLDRVDVDAIWMTEFDDSVFEAPSEDGPATPTLEEVAQCWSATPTAEAARRGFVEAFGRTDTLRELDELAEGSVPSPVVIVGPARVGKTSLVKHLAWERIARDDGKRAIWFADSPRMVSTDAFAMDWRQQCQTIVAELEDSDHILYMGRLVEALDAGKYVGSDYNLAQFLKAMLSDRRLRVIAEATPHEWNELETRDVGFARTFTVVRLEDPREEEARRIVRQAAVRVASREDIEIPDAAVDRAWALQKRFATDGSIVGRSIDFVRRTVRVAANDFRKTVSVEELVFDFCQDTGLPPVLLLDDRQLDVSMVRETLAERVLGQDEAVTRVADIVGITKAGLSPPERPLGSFLFVGPTGVGKTELARALADYLFGDEDRMVRLDMSEYSRGDAYARLIGEGRDDGDLTGPIRRQPFSLILLDEIEKADAGVFDVLLQVLGEARLTDVNGRTTSFRNAIVIMTSNLGVDTLRPSIGFGEESVEASWESHFRREAERFFRPEFLARIDQFIPFRPLSETVVEQIAERELGTLQRRDGLRSQDVELILGERVHQWVAARGWDRRYGARPLKRVIEQEIIAELGRRMAETNDDVEAGTSRRFTVTVPKGSTRKVGLQWQMELTSGRSSEATARRALLAQLETIADLRRRLQRHMYTAVFGDLEWQVENFDVSSQSPQFWDDPQASDIARDAEYARRVVEPAVEIATELAALEDLANEAYHGRSFALSDDIDERVDELMTRVSSVVLSILRGAYESPDTTTLYLLETGLDAADFRAQLVDWYLKHAKSRDWTVKIWRSRPRRDLPALEDGMYIDEKREGWERTYALEGNIIALEISGYAARPLCRPEDGLHRLISADGNATIDVYELDTYSDWPWPQRLLDLPPRTYTARTYNFRTREVLAPAAPTVKLDPNNPFAEMTSVIDEAAWRITESEWE